MQPSKRRARREFAGSSYSNVDVEPEIDVTGSDAATNPPIAESNVAHNDRDVVSRNAERLEALDDFAVQSALRVERTSSEGVDAHQRVAIGLSLAGGTGKPVRLVSHKPDVSVARRNPERRSQRRVDRIHQRYLFLRRVLPAHLH